MELFRFLNIFQNHRLNLLACRRFINIRIFGSPMNICRSLFIFFRFRISTTIPSWLYWFTCIFCKIIQYFILLLLQPPQRFRCKHRILFILAGSRIRFFLLVCDIEQLICDVARIRKRNTELITFTYNHCISVMVDTFLHVCCFIRANVFPSQSPAFPPESWQDY